MARFFFHVSNHVNNSNFKDDVHRWFSNPDEATAHAAVIARELREDADWDGYSVVVVDSQGNAIARVPIEE